MGRLEVVERLGNIVCAVAFTLFLGWIAVRVGRLGEDEDGTRYL